MKLEAIPLTRGGQVKQNRWPGSPAPALSQLSLPGSPCSHVVLVPVGVPHDLLHTHILLGAVILAQVVISDNHSESHRAGERGKPEGLPFPLGGKLENGLAA